MFSWNYITKCESWTIFLLTIVVVITIGLNLPHETSADIGRYSKLAGIGIFTYLLFASLYLAFKKIVKKHHTKYKQKN